MIVLLTDDRPVLAVVVEAQLRRDPDKRWSWPPGARLAPLVLGPERMPLVTDAAQVARHPQTVVLSALAHAADPPPHKVLDALMAAFVAVDDQHAGLCTDVVLAALPLVARRYLEELMSAR